MTTYVLDTNVVSEATKQAPDPRVAAFLNGSDDDFWIPSVVVHELEYGVELLPYDRRRNQLRALVDGILFDYRNRILPLDRAGAEWAARYRAQVQSSGGFPDLGDALIAGIARANDMAIATRNVRHFEGLGIAIANPWQTP